MKGELTLLSWNVNGFRAVLRKGFAEWFAAAAPDVLCLQETRVEAGQVPAGWQQPPGYRAFWHSGRRRGYSGTAVLTRPEPEEVQFGLGIPEFDAEGRTITVHYADFTLVNAYFPNGGRDRARVPFKLAFCEAFLAFCERLRAEGRAVLFCGDLNTAHRAIDLTHPKANEQASGFLPEERAWIDRVIAAGWVDTFRHFYPDLRDQYTWWSVPTGARSRNVGWRIDYVFAAAEVMPRVTAAFILPEVMGSDHCPVGIRWQSRLAV